jgi:hypothetical protein
MASNGGWSALPPAASTFVDFFDNVTDQMALITFASNARVDVPLQHQFKAPIQAAIPQGQSSYVGFTFFTGGLQLGFQETESATTSPGDELVKIIVFFTDGLANTFQDTFDCPPPGTILNLSSADAGNQVFALDPVTGIQVCATSGAGEPLTCCPSLAFNPVNGGPPHSVIGPNAGRDVRLEAKERARDQAKRIRTAGTVIYTIGLGTGLDEVLLQEIANDPDYPTYKPAQPAGEYEHAPNAAALQDVFRKIARKILIRLSI